MGKPQSKDLVEHGIYKTNKKDVYDVRVQRNIKETKNAKNSKQYFRRRNGIEGIMEARKVRRRLEDELAELELKKQGGDIQFKVALDMYIEYLQNRISSKVEGAITLGTLTDRRDTLRKYSDVIKDTNITDIKRSKIEEIVRGDYHPEIKNATTTRKKKILSFFRLCFEYHMAEFGRIRVNPATGISFKNSKPAEPPLLMTVEEVGRLLAHVKENNEYWHNVYTVAIHTGLRSGELYALRWTDIDFNGDMMTVQRSFETKTGEYKAPKNGHYRHVPLDPKIKLFLQELKLKATDQASYVFDRKSAWEKGQQKKILNRFQDEVSVPRSKFHGLRGLFITSLLRTGCSAVYVQEIAGHADIKTTTMYIGLAGVKLKGKSDALADLFSFEATPSIASLEEERKKREKKAE